MEWNREQGVATPCFEKRGKLCLDSSVSSINNQSVEMVIVFAMTKDHCDTVSYAGTPSVWRPGILSEAISRALARLIY